ncbi:S-adenosyl-L-methionine-dependent methyltransferase [Dissophora ornata]|nr:S-adenosyl-L-methionine-dependent methyltransferase [Dissophora ornata]
MFDIQAVSNNNFSKIGQDYDLMPQVAEVTLLASKVILQEFTISTSEEHVKNSFALEFGCGTGLCMFYVAREVKQVLGVDVSEGMLQHLNQKLETRNENTDIRDKIKTVNHLITEDAILPEPEFSQYLSGPDAGFGLIYSSFVMHHIDDVQRIVNTLSGKLLKKDGWLIVTDFQSSHEGHGHHNSTAKDVQDLSLDALGKPVKFIPKMVAFTPEGFAEVFKKAGLVDVSAKHAFEIDLTMHGHKDIFVAKGHRP